eukprot:3477490-Pyramimonas_sp.AAC.1
MGLNDVAPATVDVSQRGGVRGRNILGNVVEVEKWGLIQHMCGRDKAGVLFTDFKAAFPSILAEWIFLPFWWPWGFLARPWVSSKPCAPTIRP